MKVKLNPMFEQVRGQLGELVFREVRGETIASRKPTFTGVPTADQVDHRERFKLAVAYGKTVMADDNIRPLYESASNNKNLPVFALTVADFLNAPRISAVDLDGYAGQANELIEINTLDDFGVMAVHVAIKNNATNAVLENGQAVETAPGSGQWIYTAQSNIAAGTAVEVHVVATDRPGGAAIASLMKNL